MKLLNTFITLSIISLMGCSNQPKEITTSPAKIIFDTDLGPDYDDVGAI